MEYRRLGSTGVEVSTIGFGCGGRARLMVGEDHDLQVEAVALALKLGISHFDTAAAYGQGRSERNLGRALSSLGAAPVISTKVAVADADRSDPRSAVLAGFEDSLKRLGRDSVDLLFLHNRVARQPSGGNVVGPQLSEGEVLGRGGVAEAFAELIEAGAIRAGGITMYGGDPVSIRKAIHSGAFSVVNASFSAVNPSAIEAIAPPSPLSDFDRLGAEAAAAGLGVMAIQALGHGALIGSAEDAVRYLAPGEFPIGTEDSLTALAIRYVLSKRGITSAVLGFSEPSHVREAVDAAESGPLTADQIETLERVVARASGTASAPTQKGY